MRNAFAKEITRLAKRSSKLVLLSGDIGNRLFDEYKEIPNSNFLNCGIAEANMMGVAAGLAMSGLKPIIYTITPFTTTRCFEQIRVDVCYHNVPVIIIGTGSGLSYASLGPTHHSLEDFAIFRALPNITILAPSDAIELKKCLNEALKMDTPVYIRIGKKGEDILTKESMPLKIGKSINFKKGKEVCLIGTGTIMSEVLKAAELLESKGISTCVEGFHTIKPLDKFSLKRLFSLFDVISVIEEHSSIGGLFGAISEWRALENNFYNPQVLSFGAKDEFMHEVGTQQHARKKNGIDALSIFNKTFKAYQKRKKE
jgi:transketolase